MIYQIQEASASSSEGKGGVSTGGGNGDGASVEPTVGGSWGNREGTEEDMEILSDLIKEALRDPANGGNSIFTFT